ncbi:unnamed protein product [Pleuronectes platessa]|uniref:Uncharacterized protein n=1 Tax=Pleuronectes platessa TaxID=8262 RepID=A0A9N7UH85_PLEPL|nr:unnamed protein product [Pleuronectes platessa]
MIGIAWGGHSDLQLTLMIDPGAGISACAPPERTGTSAQGSSLLASLPLPGRPLQPQLDLKHLLPFRLNGSSPLSLFPNFNTPDLILLCCAAASPQAEGANLYSSVVSPLGIAAVASVSASL